MDLSITGPMWLRSYQEWYRDKSFKNLIREWDRYVRYGI